MNKHHIKFAIGGEIGEVVLSGSSEDVDDVITLYSKVYKAKNILVEYNTTLSKKPHNVKQALNYAHGVSVAAGYSGVFE